MPFWYGVCVGKMGDLSVLSQRHIPMKSLALPLVALLTLVFAGTPAHIRAADDPFAWQWYELDKNQDLQINLYIFWRSNCPHCAPALAYANKMRQRHPWLKVRRYELNQYPPNLTFYQKMADKLGRPAGQTPAFFFCNQMVLGYVSDEQSGRQIEANLIRCYEHLKKQLEEKKKGDSTFHRSRQRNDLRIALAASPRVPALAAIAVLGQAAPVADDGAPASDAAEFDDADLLGLELPPPVEATEQEESVTLPVWGEVKTSEFSLPLLTLVIAGCDAFNPCAFFVLLSLLGVLIHGHSRWRMAAVGGIFVMCSGVFYFLFMAAWLNVFLIAGHWRAITIVAGVLAVAAAAINIKDYFFFKQGVSLSIPEGAKPGLFQRMRRLTTATRLAPMLLGAFALAAAANAYELLCTAGFPMIYTRILTLRELPTASYYGYLALYNLIYVTPLATIVAVFTVTLGARKLQEREGRILKLASGVMMLLLGGVILLAPNLLQNVAAAIGILVGALVLTAVIVLVDRAVRGGSTPTGPTKRRRAGSHPSDGKHIEALG